MANTSSATLRFDGPSLLAKQQRYSMLSIIRGIRTPAGTGYRCFRIIIQSLSNPHLESEVSIVEKLSSSCGGGGGGGGGGLTGGNLPEFAVFICY